MPGKTKMKNAAIAAPSAALPKIPKELIDQFVSGPRQHLATSSLHSGLRVVARKCSGKPGVIHVPARAVRYESAGSPHS